MNFNETIGTIMLWAEATTPPNWVDCDGRVMDSASNEFLFSAIGASFGGDGETTFALPDLPNLGTARYIICVEGNIPYHVE